MTAGIHALVPHDKMSPAARKIRDAYAIKPGVPFLQREFGFYSLDRWIAEGHLPKENTTERMDEVFQYEPTRSRFDLRRLGWCEAGFAPGFETKVLADCGAYELVQNHAGRQMLCFKGRRRGFMPEYVDHPVKDLKSWVEQCGWRLDRRTPSRYAKLDETRAAPVRRGRGGQLRELCALPPAVLGVRMRSNVNTLRCHGLAVFTSQEDGP